MKGLFEWTLFLSFLLVSTTLITAAPTGERNNATAVDVVDAKKNETETKKDVLPTLESSKNVTLTTLGEKKSTTEVKGNVTKPGVVASTKVASLKNSELLLKKSTTKAIEAPEDRKPMPKPVLPDLIEEENESKPEEKKEKVTTKEERKEAPRAKNPYPVDIGDRTAPSGHGFFYFLAILIVFVISYTYRKKFLGMFVGNRGRSGSRRGGNIRYRKLSTGETAAMD